MSKTLYVGGYPFSTTADELHQLFSRYGTVANVNQPMHPVLGGSLGFAFVEMADGADDAMAALDGTEYKGRLLIVNEAERQPESKTSTDDLWDRFNTHYNNQEGPEFQQVLRELHQLACTGDAYAASQLAEVLAFEGPLCKPEVAYKWYYVAAALDGCLVAFDDQNHTPPSYGGPDGDFRNEAIVADLVRYLGFEKVQQLDEQAARWLKQKKLL